MPRKRDNFTLAWERNEAVVRLRYPDLTDEDLRILERLKVVPLATGELVPGPETVLEVYRMTLSKGKKSPTQNDTSGTR